MSDYTSTPSRPASPVGVLPEIPAARPYRFTWDSSRRPGPRSVSETTEGRGDYFTVKSPSGLYNLNASTLNLASAVLPPEWSSTRQGFNAISTVLNNPHKRQAPPKAHSALPSVKPAELPHVRRKDFDSYLNAIAPEWERFDKSYQLAQDGSTQMEGPSTPRASSVSELPASSPTSKLPGLQSMRTLPPLSSVPSVFFEPAFNLGDARTFAAVTEQQEGQNQTSDPSSLSHSLPLLEKMSHYADTIEQHLVREISLRSTSFFAALSNLQDLQTESEQCLDRISQLRGLLKDVDEKGAKRGLHIVRKEVKIRNLHAVQHGVKLLSGVIEMTSLVRSLVNAGQWGEALDVIDQLNSLWQGPLAHTPAKGDVLSKPGSLPSLPEETNGHTLECTTPAPSTAKLPYNILLLSLRAFASLPTHLQALTAEVASSLTSEVVQILRSDLAERIESRLKSSNVSPGNQEVDRSLKDRLRPLLQGLRRTRHVREAMRTWREAVMGEIKETIKRHVSFDIDDEDSPDRSQQNVRAGLANHLRNLPHTEFLALLRSIYRSLLNGIEGLQVQEELIVQVIGSSQPMSQPLDLSALQEDLVDILSSTAEYSNAQAAKIVTSRSDQHTKLSLLDFLAFFNESWDFVVKCEVICRRMIVSLRGVVVSQAKSFLQTFHQSRISSSAKLVEDEQWGPADVSSSVQHVTDIIVASAVNDSPELIIPRDSQTPTSNVLSQNGVESPQLRASSPSAPPAQANGSASVSKKIRIEGASYFVVSATVDVLILLLDYLKVIVNLSLLTTDTMSRVIEFLKAFNSRTCQVVLGAGAMRSAGLRNITAKHLALASQSLSIMIALIPYVRETFRRHLSQKQAVMLVEFDKLKRDYQEHQNEIHSKLIAIMGDRLTAHIKSLQAIKWDVPSPAISVNSYMELLVKETVTLHKVLSRYLSAPVVEYVMTQVFAAITHRLSEEYSVIELPTQEAKERLLADARFLHQKLSGLQNVSLQNSMLETVIAEKAVASKTMPLPNTTTHPSSVSANQRILGMLSRKNSQRPTPAIAEKALPTPTLSSPPSQAGVSLYAESLAPTAPVNSTPGANEMGSERPASVAAATVPLPPSHNHPPSGFKQIDPNADHEGISSPLLERPVPGPEEDGGMTSVHDDLSVVSGTAAFQTDGNNESE